MLNSFIGIGRLGRDAELLTSRDGSPVARFAIAIDRNSKNKDAPPDWINCSLYGDRARQLAPYLEKGRLVGVQGRLETYKRDVGGTGFAVSVQDVSFLTSTEKHANGEKPAERHDFPPPEEDQPDELGDFDD